MLERRLVDEKDTERALASSSDCAANVGTITALDPDIILSDELNHASIVDGAQLSDADIAVYDHCDADALSKAMADRAGMAAPDDSWLIITDS